MNPTFAGEQINTLNFNAGSNILTIEATELPSPQIRVFKNPERLVIDLNHYLKTPPNQTVLNAIVKKIRTGHKKDSTRIVLDMRTNISSYQIVTANQTRLVIQLNKATAGALAQISQPSIPVTKKRIFVWPKIDYILGLGITKNQTSNTHLVASAFETDSLKVKNIPLSGNIKLGVGNDFLFSSAIPIRVELNYYYTYTKISGHVYQYGFPQFNNLNFNAYNSSNRIMLELKPYIFRNVKQLFSGYVNLGIGPNFNSMHYREHITDPDLPSGSNYLLTSYTQLNLAYQIGLGVSQKINDKFTLALDYLYIDLGSAKPSTHNRNSNTPLKAPTFQLKNQGLFLSLIYKPNEFKSTG